MRIIAHSLRHLADALFPGKCILCGSIVTDVPWYPAPLCEICERTLERISGPRCICCGRSVISEAGLCMHCREHSMELRHVVPVFRYAGSAARLIKAYKLEGRRSLAVYFVQALINVLPIALGTDEAQASALSDLCIVPVPPRPEKICAGGFDQVGYLAQLMAGEGFSVWNGLERRSNVEQKTLARDQRFENARSAYSIRDGAPEPPRRVLLLDDVCTTGATLDACRNILSSRGVKVEGALVLAAD